MLFWVKVVPPQEFQTHMDQLRAAGQTGLQPMGIVPTNSPEVAALKSEADQAVSRLNGSSLDGRTIKVEKSTGAGPGGGRGPRR